MEKENKKEETTYQLFSYWNNGLKCDFKGGLKSPFILGKFGFRPRRLGRFFTFPSKYFIQKKKQRNSSKRIDKELPIRYLRFKRVRPTMSREELEELMYLLNLKIKKHYVKDDMVIEINDFVLKMNREWTKFVKRKIREIEIGGKK